MTLGLEKTPPPICQPIGATRQSDAVFGKVQHMNTSILTSKYYSEPQKLTKCVGIYLELTFMQFCHLNDTISKFTPHLPSSRAAQANPNGGGGGADRKKKKI